MDIASLIIHDRNKLLSGSEDSFKNLLFDTKPVMPTFDERTKLDFSYPQVSAKVKYFKRQIDNALTTNLNNAIESQSVDTTKPRILNHLMKMKRETKSALENSQTLIDAQGYDLERLGAKGARFSEDIEYYEMTYIFHYLQQSYIRWILEFQEHFLEFIPDDKRITPELIYNEYLQMAVPEAFPVRTIQTIEVKPEKKEPELDLDVEVEMMPTLAQIFVDKTKPYGFLELPMVAKLKEKQKLKFITHITAQGIPYVSAMLEYLGYPKHLKNEHDFTREDVFAHIAKALNGVSHRQVKGNLNILRPNSKEKADKYTACQYVSIVKEDYNNFLNGTD